MMFGKGVPMKIPVSELLEECFDDQITAVFVHHRKGGEFFCIIKHQTCRGKKSQFIQLFVFVCFLNLYSALIVREIIHSTVKRSYRDFRVYIVSDIVQTIFAALQTHRFPAVCVRTCIALIHILSDTPHQSVFDAVHQLPQRHISWNNEFLYILVSFLIVISQIMKGNTNQQLITFHFTASHLSG